MSDGATPPPKIALIGAGLMGEGLARLFAGIGWPVTLWDRDPVAGRRVAAAVPATGICSDIANALAAADFVIEAIAEIAEAKQSLFADLAMLAPADAILATNSSVIPVATVAARVRDAARIVGTHFWNPPDLIPLVEVIAGPRSAECAIERTMAMLTAAGREPVRVRRDVVPGNRLQHALWREAMTLVDEGVCTAAEIDHIVRRSFGARLAVLGPLENADLIGLELTSQIHRVVLPTLSRATEPAAGLQARIAAGDTGAQAGRGFFPDWTATRITEVRARLTEHLRAAFGGERE